MVNLQQVRALAKQCPKLDDEVDLDGDEGFLLYTIDPWVWDELDPGCHTRGWAWDEVTLKEIKDDIKHIGRCDGSCGSPRCKTKENQRSEEG